MRELYRNPMFRGAWKRHTFWSGGALLLWELPCGEEGKPT